MADFTPQHRRLAYANRPMPRLTMRMMSLGVALATTAWLTGCTSAPAPTTTSGGPTVASMAEDGSTTVPLSQATSSTPTDSPEEGAILVPTVSVEPEAVDVPVQESDWTETVTVEGDYYIRGNPAAPVRLIDYSDFL